jgi:hypothetical protein
VAHTWSVRIEIRDRHERHAAVGWNVAEELFEGLQPPSGSADADYGKTSLPSATSLGTTDLVDVLGRSLLTTTTSSGLTAFSTSAYCRGPSEATENPGPQLKSGLRNTHVT